MRKQSNESPGKNHNSPPTDAVFSENATMWTVATIVEVTGVDPKTARRWLAGTQQPGPVALRLLNLHAHGRVVPDSPDWRRWRFHGEQLTFDRSNWSADGAHLRFMFLSRDELARANGDLANAREYIGYLEGLLPRADVVPLDGARPGSAPVYTANPYFGQRKDDSTPDRLLALRQAGQL
jgi:hypothetical protein